MKQILMCVLLLSAWGCSDDIPRAALQPPKPATTTTDCGHPHHAAALAVASGAWSFRCENLSGYPDTTIGVDTTMAGATIDSLGVHPSFPHPELKLLALTGGTITGHDAEGDIEAYLYPFVLFPDGSKFQKYQITGTLLCADVNGSGFGALLQLHTENTMAWAGQILPNTEEARNLEFRKYGARLVVGETDNATWITGAHITLPGKQNVWLSHAGRR